MINAMLSSIWRIREYCAGIQDCLCADLELWYLFIEEQL